MQRLLPWSACAVAAAAALALFASCGPAGETFSHEPVGADASDAAKHPSRDGGIPDAKRPPIFEASADGAHLASNPVFEPTGPVTDFPAPILDGTAPADSTSLFGPPSSGAGGGGPCIVEPESDVLYPQNWLRPRFTWVPVGGQNLFELRLRVKNQKRDLVVYTSRTQWTMPVATWDALRAHSPTEPMLLSIKGGVYDGTKLTQIAKSATYPLGIAPVQATGAMMYWTATNGTSLKGFSVGDESVTLVLAPPQVTETKTGCIGCHTAVPGGEYVSFSLEDDAGWPNAIALSAPDAGPEAGAVGSPPSYLGAGASAALARPDLGISTFSPAHWAPGDRRMIVAYDDPKASPPTSVLQWIDVEATSLAKATGTLARTGDPNPAGAPAWSHDGKTVAYVSTPKFCTGRVGGGCDGSGLGHTDPGSTADIYTVPYAGGAGGKATPLPGASGATVQEYYPVFSPDDAWIAFDSIPNDLDMYNQSSAEVYVIPSSGGTATRLAANDPPACSGVASPGVTNSWPKWGPTALDGNGSRYYWLVFSSTRAKGSNPQLYVTGVVQTGSKIETHGALYLWNQPPSESNHTPAWDTFQVAPIPPPPK